MKKMQFTVISLSLLLVFTACKKQSPLDFNEDLITKEKSTVIVGKAPPPPGEGICLGSLVNYLFVFADGNEDANWQGATKGFAGSVVVNGLLASERTSGGVPYSGILYTNASTQGDWQNILDQNLSQTLGFTDQTWQVNSAITDLNNAFELINDYDPSVGYESVSSTSLNGLNTMDGIGQVYVINITSGLTVNSKINISGDDGDVFILRWDSDGNPKNGYQGTTKFQSGGAIVPQGNLIPSNFVNVAGNIASSGGGDCPVAPYPQGPRLDDGLGSLIENGQDFNGGGFFTGYWLTTGDPITGKTSSLSNAIFVGGWYTTSKKFSMTSGTSGVYVSPPQSVSCASR